MSSGDINYMHKLALRPLSRRIQNEILVLADGINAVQRLNFLVFIYHPSEVPGINRIASIRFFRKFFRVHAHRIQSNGRLDVDDPYPFVEIQNGTEDYSRIMAVIKSSLRHLGAPL